MPDAQMEISGTVQNRAMRGSVAAAKWATAKRVFRNEGARGVAAVFNEKATAITRPSADRLRRSVRAWLQREHWWAGLIVVLRGDVVRLDSCEFLVRHPAITTAAKSLFLFGTYEGPERAILKKYLDRTSPVVELGGSIGVVACVTNTMIADRRKHVVVEANPDLIDLLLANRDRNGCEFTVVHRALAYGGADTVFYRHPTGFLAGSVQVESATPVRVAATSLRAILDEHRFERCTLVCDIEGGEMDLVRHELRVLQERVELFIVEVHGWRVGHDLAEEMLRGLDRGGFRCLHEQEGTYVFRNDRLTPAEPSGPGAR